MISRFTGVSRLSFVVAVLCSTSVRASNEFSARDLKGNPVLFDIFGKTFSSSALNLQGLNQAKMISTAHALKACFATQFLAHDIAPARVMKVCGWKDLKTMQRYVRLAGIDEQGVTQLLRVMPSDEAVMAEVVNLLEFKARSE